MGVITNFNLKAVKERLGISHFIETGTCYGDACHYALMSGYSVESCEISSKLHWIANDRFKKFTQAKIENATSKEFLMTSSDIRSVYWLDAHYPRAKGEYSQETALPLFMELKTIRSKDWIHESIVIIDDISLYPDILEWCKLFEGHRVYTSKEYLVLWPKGGEDIKILYNLPKVELTAL